MYGNSGFGVFENVDIAMQLYEEARSDGEKKKKKKKKGRG